MTCDHAVITMFKKIHLNLKRHIANVHEKNGDSKIASLYIYAQRFAHYGLTHVQRSAQKLAHVPRSTQKYFLPDTIAHEVLRTK